MDDDGVCGTCTNIIFFSAAQLDFHNRKDKQRETVFLPSGILTFILWDSDGSIEPHVTSFPMPLIPC